MYILKAVLPKNYKLRYRSENFTVNFEVKMRYFNRFNVRPSMRVFFCLEDRKRVLLRIYVSSRYLRLTWWFKNRFIFLAS